MDEDVLDPSTARRVHAGALRGRGRRTDFTCGLRSEEEESTVHRAAFGEHI
jgi:hypothetical protein